LGSALRPLKHSKDRPINLTIQVYVENINVVQQTTDPVMQKIKILFVSANPPGITQLKLDEEARAIQAKIRAAKHRDSIEFIAGWAARPDDLLQLLNEHQPHVVHFSGHGSPTEEIILLDSAGNAIPVSKAALVSLFRTLRNNIRVVLLNACYSRPQAAAITKEIDCAIGMTRAIGDDAAIIFASSFYRAVGFGRSIQEAFDQGKTALLLEGIPEERTPKLICKKTILAESIVLIKSR
jgi:CHAT domain-containing protein